GPAGPGRVRHPDRSRLDETARRSAARDDVAAKGTQAGDHRPRRRSGDPEFRADQESCGAVGRTAGADRLTGFGCAGSLDRAAPPPKEGGPCTAPSPPLSSHNGGAVLLIFPRAALDQVSLADAGDRV